MYFCLDKCFWGSFMLVIAELENCEEFHKVWSSLFAEANWKFCLPTDFATNTAQATSTISIHEKSHLTTHKFQNNASCKGVSKHH